MFYYKDTTGTFMHDLKFEDSEYDMRKAWVIIKSGANATWPSSSSGPARRGHRGRRDARVLVLIARQLTKP